jgi:formamidopyrimidine-DNA glycosylase
MPELPEVETVVRALRPELIGRRIEGAWLDWEGSLKTPSPADFLARIARQSILELDRRAKYIRFRLSEDYLLIHLKMSGRLYVAEAEKSYEADKWVHFRFDLDDGRQLRFSDARKFGTVHLSSQPEQYLGALGPEPLSPDFHLEGFQAALAKHRTAIKPLLLQQGFLAGVGNIYADEALHRAHVAPFRPANSLNAQESAALYAAIRQVLELGIERQGASISWYRQPNGETGSMQDDFWAYDRTGQPCRICGRGQIKKIVLGQRGTHYCPECQR